MRITKALNDQLMVMAAVRYCLGRQSYIVGACIEWIRAHKGQFDPNTFCVLLRDICEASARNEAGADFDREAWAHLALDMWNDVDQLNPPGTNWADWLKHALCRYKDTPLAVFTAIYGNDT